MKRNIIFLLGEAGSGKDTVGKEFVKLGYTRVSFADAMKQQYADLNNIDVQDLHIQGLKKEIHRPKLIEFAENERKKDNLIWLKTAFKPYFTDEGKFKDKEFNIVITDFRRESEAYWYYNSIVNNCDSDINLKLFYISKPDTEDKDTLTHLTIGIVKGINFIHPGFINATIFLPEGRNFTEKQYEEFRKVAEKKVKKLKELFSL